MIAISILSTIAMAFIYDLSAAFSTFDGIADMIVSMPDSSDAEVTDMLRDTLWGRQDEPCYGILLHRSVAEVRHQAAVHVEGSSPIVLANGPVGQQLPPPQRWTSHPVIPCGLSDVKMWVEFQRSSAMACLNSSVRLTENCRRRQEQVDDLNREVRVVEDEIAATLTRLGNLPRSRHTRDDRRNLATLTLERTRLAAVASSYAMILRRQAEATRREAKATRRADASEARKAAALDANLMSPHTAVDCPICQNDDLVPGYIRNGCGHGMCVACTTAWFDTCEARRDGGFSCPICRGGIVGL